MYKPEKESNNAKPRYSDYEMARQHTFGEQPPDPYEATTPYTPSIPAPYSPTTPYTPSSAYTPITPSTWKKEELSRWPTSPYKRIDDY